jgi:hypothetical protein
MLLGCSLLASAKAIAWRTYQELLLPVRYRHWLRAARQALVQRMKLVPSGLDAAENLVNKYPS